MQIDKQASNQTSRVRQGWSIARPVGSINNGNTNTKTKMNSV